MTKYQIIKILIVNCYTYMKEWRKILEKIIKRVISIMLAIVLIPIMPSSLASAKSRFTSKLDLPKDNVQYIVGKVGDTYSEYTYSSEGQKFKVIDNANENFTNVNSIIYLLKDDNKYEEYATEKVTIENDICTITITENGYSTTETFNYINQEQSSVYSRDSWLGMPVTDWIYCDTYKGSTKFQKYTAAAVVAVLTTLASSFFNIPGQCVIAGVSAIAGIIVDDAIETVYFSRKYYWKLCIPPKGMVERAVAEKNVVTYYSDKSRKNKIGTNTYYKYDYDYVKQ